VWGKKGQDLWLESGTELENGDGEFSFPDGERKSS